MTGTRLRVQERIAASGHVKGSGCRGVVRPQAVGELACEVALIASMDRGRNTHGDETAEAGERHVLLRIPDVSLSSQIGRGRVAAEDDGDAPFDQFVEGTEG